MTGANVWLIDEFREEFYKLFCDKENKLSEPFFEIQYGDKIGLKYPISLLKPSTVKDYVTALEMMECKFVLKSFLECGYDYKERYRDKNRSVDCYVLTNATASYVWVMEASVANATFWLRWCTLAEIRKYEKLEKIPLQMVAVKYAIDLSYAQEW